MALFHATFILSGTTIFGYGPQGHEMVGDIASLLLEGTPTEAILADSHHLNGLSLGLAAKLPDAIKSWDTDEDADSTDLGELSKYPNIEQQLRAFHDQNMDKTAGTSEVLHRQFHFADVEVKNSEKYSSGEIGTSDHDLVQMIRFCVQVLDGNQPEDNKYKITKPVAVILLCHYVGDIHQPLHVGAEYFDSSGNFADPDKGETAFPDRGGNSLSVKSISGISMSNNPKYPTNLHGLWDGPFVLEAFKQIRGGRKGLDIAQFYVDHEPSNWKTPVGLGPEDWSVFWANEILPIAAQAYQRLDYSEMSVKSLSGVQTAKGYVSENDARNPDGYKKWAGSVVRDEIGKAGWRLSALLQATVK